MDGLLPIIIALTVLMIVILIAYYQFSSIKAKDVGVGAADVLTGFVEQIGENLDIGTKGVGEQCDTVLNCADNLAGTPDKTNCCNGICTIQQRDWAGVGYCPDECKDAPDPLGGRCDRGYSWPRGDGQPCDTNQACAGFAPGQNTLGCDNGTCRQQKRDWAGVYYNASECRDAPGAPTGSCNSGNTWPRSENQHCNLNEDCNGFRPGQDSLACDHNRCVRQKKDWAGVWYKPSECKGGPWSGHGSC